MAGHRGGTPLPLPLLSLAVLYLVLGTTAMDVIATVPPTHPTSLAPMETSALLPTNSTTATLPACRPETAASTPGSSTSPGSSSTSSPSVPAVTSPALTAASAEPLTTPSDTTDTPDTRTGVSGSTPTPSQLAGTMTRTTPGISTLTVEPSQGTPTAPATPSAATGTEGSSPDTDSTQTSEISLSTPADLPTTLPVCPTTTSNTSASHLFLSLRLTIPLDLRNTTVQELVLAKLCQDLQTTFPCAGLSVEWRGQRRT